MKITYFYQFGSKLILPLLQIKNIIMKFYYFNMKIINKIIFSLIDIS